jgi:hypothetical protein
MSIPRLPTRLASVAALVPLLLTPFAACSRAPDSAPDPGPIASASQAIADAACPGTGSRWVGRQSSTIDCTTPSTGIHCPCPTAGISWQATRAFELQDGVQTSIPTELATYCVYEWTGSGDTDPLAPPSVVGIDGSTWNEDTVVVASLSAPPDAPGQALDNEGKAPFEPAHASPAPALRSWLRDGFRDVGRGGLDTLPVGIAPRENVEIAILDTSPTDTDGGIPLGASAHGHVIGWTARDLLCDAPMSIGCFTHVSTYLTLPYVTTKKVDCSQGGAFGTRVDLARQIFRAVETWKHGSSQRPHLVLPLALGWDPSFGKPGDTASLAVHDALVHASCQGVFLAAAAGNDAGGPSPATGALYPAAWESESAPTPAACQSFEGNAWSLKDPIFGYPPLPPANVNAPLLLSIGGVDRDDQPIALTRPKSLTRLLALAFLADAGDPELPLPQPFTGTSIGVTVAGAAAAAAWAYNPAITAREVMNLLVDTASPLLNLAPALMASNTAAPGRISLCEAIARACSSPGAIAGARCPPAPVACSDGSSHVDIPLPPPLAKSLDVYFAAAAPRTGTAQSASFHELFPAPPPGEWTHPQPIDPGCSVCTFNPRRGLYVELDGRVPLPTWMTLTLYFSPAATGGTGSTARNEKTYTFGTQGQYSMNVAIPVTGQVTGAMISWRGTTGSIAEEIAVIP